MIRPERQPPQVGRQRHQHVVDRQACGGDQDHRAAAVLVGQRADHRRGEELHQRPQRDEHAVDDAGARIGAGELLDQRRQDRDDDAHRQDVEHRGDQDEGDRGLAGAEGDRRHGFGFRGVRWVVPAQRADARKIPARRRDAGRNPAAGQGKREASGAGFDPHGCCPSANKGRDATAGTGATPMRGGVHAPAHQSRNGGASAHFAASLGIHPLRACAGL